MVQLTKANTNSMGTEISQEQKNVPGVIPDKWLNIAVKETFNPCLQTIFTFNIEQNDCPKYGKGCNSAKSVRLTNPIQSHHWRLCAKICNDFEFNHDCNFWVFNLKESYCEVYSHCHEEVRNSHMLGYSKSCPGGKL